MSILSRLAGAQGRRDEEPNKELARELVQKNDLAAIQEVAENLRNPDRRIRIDCLAVLEQVGLLQPTLIQDYAADFIELVTGRDNRLVWAAMINLALIADRKATEIFEHYDSLLRVIEKGSVITKDNGIKTLARVAAANPEYGRTIMPYLLEQLGSCRSKSLPQYAESVRVAVNPENQDGYLSLLNQRLDALSSAQQRRVKKLVKSFRPGPPKETS